MASALNRRQRAIGIQLGEHQSMITGFTPSLAAPQTVRSKQDGTEGYTIPVSEDVWKAARGLGEPIEKLSVFFASCLELAIVEEDKKTLSVMVTVPKLDKLMGERIPMALELLGLQRKNVYIQDYLSSFFFYAINERPEARRTDTALFEYDQEMMYGYVLHVDRTKTPAVATVKCAAKQSVNDKNRDGRDDHDWDRERDRLLFELAKKVFEGRHVTNVFLMGDYYSQDWAVKSYQYLCGGRHAFQGKNLYTKGACYAAMERCGLLQMPDILFMGEEIVRDNLGMVMRVRGKTTYYPLVTAGINWYEAHHHCEFIADDEQSVDILSKSMEGGEEVHHVLRLGQLPQRPARTTRLGLDLYFVSPTECVIEVEDMGFGVLYRSSGRRWKRTIRL